MQEEIEHPGLINHLTGSAGVGRLSLQMEILAGLKEKPRRIPSKFFYDATGSALFEKITPLPEYYLTACEKEILSGLWDKLRLTGPDIRIIELGSGDGSKLMLLLDQLPPDRLKNIVYYPVDISAAAVRDAVKKLNDNFPGLRVGGILADFTKQLHLLPVGGTRIFCFFGSTIGNLDPDEARNFMMQLGAVMKHGDHLLLGIDMVKEPVILENAYNDKQGVTARFNQNILQVVNGLMEADFDPSMFAHEAFYNSEKQRVEMHLQARKEMLIKCGVNGSRILISEGETIHTENSYKFSPCQIEDLGKAGGVRVKEIFADSKDWFGVVHFHKPAASFTSRQHPGLPEYQHQPQNH